MGTYIYINRLTDFVVEDLSYIARAATGLRFTLVSRFESSAIQVTFSPISILSIGARMLNQVMNENIGLADLTIVAGYPDEEVDGIPLKRSGGVTGSIRRSDGRVDAYIGYDVTLCNGEQYVTLDAGHNCILMPRPVILFHELSHCTRLQDEGRGQEEALAMRDENEFRWEIGLPRRATYMGGCRYSSGISNICYGSPDQRESYLTALAAIEEGKERPLSGMPEALRRSRNRTLVAAGVPFEERQKVLGKDARIRAVRSGPQ